MYYNILLVGAGQLGSRYLQGLSATNSFLNVTVVEPDEKAIEVAQNRWSEVNDSDTKQLITFNKKIPSDLFFVDLVIIATSSKGRAKLISDISRKIKCRFWILEKVVAQSLQDLDLIKDSVANSEGVWVNTSRRLMLWHQNIKSFVKDKSPIKVIFSGNDWGLACNSIHFIDLVSWWTGEDLTSIDSSGLNDDWFESKRKGYFEVTGKLVAHFSKGSLLDLVQSENLEKSIITIVTSDNITWEIDELLGIAQSSTGEQLCGQLEYQSKLTTSLVDHILIHGSCNLPTFEESSEMHAIFLNELLINWNKFYNLNDSKLPIT